MECNTARMLAEIRGNRVNELPADDSAALDRHLNSCPDCQSALQLEQKLDAPLLKVMCAVPVPANLKAKIFDRLATERGAVLRRKIFYAAATAAAVIVAVGIFSWNPDRKPKIDLNELVKVTDQFDANPKGSVDAWLASHGVAYKPPEPFNPHLLAFHGLVTVQGKQVPMLCYRAFEDGQAVSAKVYLVRSIDFDLSALQKPPEGGSWGERGHQVKVYGQPDKQIYVIIYNSRTLDPFLNQFRST